MAYEAPVAQERLTCVSFRGGLGMTRLFRNIVVPLLAATLLFQLAPAWADGDRDRDHSDRDRDRDRRGHDSRRWVPEFDPATAGAIAVLLAGGGVLLVRRRKR